MARVRKVHGWVPFRPKGTVGRRGNTSACRTRMGFSMTHNPKKLTCKKCNTPKNRRRMRDAA